MKEQKNTLKNIRLKQEVVKVIKEAVKNFDSNAKVLLFGSRVDISQKGGDIDLLVISNKINFDNKLKILAEIYKKIGEQKIDLIITDNIDENSFIKKAYSEGVEI